MKIYNHYLSLFLLDKESEAKIRSIINYMFMIVEYRKLGVEREQTPLVNTCSRSPEKAGLLSVANSILTELRSMPGIFGLVLKWASSLRKQT